MELPLAHPELYDNIGIKLSNLTETSLFCEDGFHRACLSISNTLARAQPATKGLELIVTATQATGCTRNVLESLSDKIFKRSKS